MWNTIEEPILEARGIPIVIQKSGETIRVDSEVLATEGIKVYLDSVPETVEWASGGVESRAEVAEHIQAAFDFAGWVVEF